MSVLEGEARVAVKEALPALGALTVFLFAWGLMQLLDRFCRALFGTAEGLVGWIPVVGRLAKQPIHKIEQKISNYIGGAERGIDAHIAASYHKLAAVIRSIPSLLVDEAGLLFGLAAALVLLPSVALVKYLIRHATAPLHTGLWLLKQYVRSKLAPLIGLWNLVRHSLWPRVAALAVAIAGIAHELPGLRTRERALEKEMARLREWVKGRRISLTTGAFLGAFVWALGKLGIGWVRCTRNKGLMKDLACSPKGDYLAGLLEAGLLIVGTISIVELAKELQDEMEFAVDGITKLVREQTG